MKMENKDYSLRSWLLLLSVIIGVAALSLVPATNVFGLETEEVDILADLRPEDDTKAAVPVDYVADFEQLESQLATVETLKADSLIEKNPARLEWIAYEESTPQREMLRSDMIKPAR
jgi:hypothetical protein